MQKKPKKQELLDYFLTAKIFSSMQPLVPVLNIIIQLNHEDLLSLVLITVVISSARDY